MVGGAILKMIAREYFIDITDNYKIVYVLLQPKS